MARMPGAIWKPIAKSRGARRKGRGICLHVAVSEAASLFGYFSGATSDSHFYVRKDGTIEQYVDTDLQAYANAAGNSTLISVETQGGVTNTNTEPWTPAQVAALARIVRWSADLDGYPIQPMPNSLPTSRGVGYHRLGCKPWVVAGGELWSSSTGKVCPGAGKIAQIPQVIAQAKGATVKATPAPIPEDDMPLTATDLAKVRDAVWQAPFDDTISNKPTQAWLMFRDMQARLGQLGGQNAALNATVKELSKAVVTLASTGDDLDVDGLVARIGERIDAAVSDAAKLVTVEVSVNDQPAA